jgi:hypothetical protein
MAIARVRHRPNPITHDHTARPPRRGGGRPPPHPAPNPPRPCTALRTYALGAGYDVDAALERAARAGAAILTGRGPYEGQLGVRQPTCPGRRFVAAPLSMRQLAREIVIEIRETQRESLMDGHAAPRAPLPPRELVASSVSPGRTGSTG